MFSIFNMCGINGFNFIDRDIIINMNKSLKHRGPDDTGFFEDKNHKVSLGHSRLSVLDLSKKASQPMVYNYCNQKAVIVFNGEIYNFKELRRNLVEKGYIFNSESDTEVILANYFEKGKNCVKDFNGMWAFCIFDIKKNILFLSRDRVGKKSLYYYFDGKKFIFSSELKAILKNKIKLELDPRGVDLYLSMGFIPSPYSIYKNIYKLEPRQNLILDLDTNKIKKNYYYEIPDYNPVNNKKKLIKDADFLLEDSIKLRMISDVPVGAFLSGGLDSSAIVKKMANFVNLKNLHTFSIGFNKCKDKKGISLDESKYAKFMGNILKTKHHNRYFIKKDFNYLLDNIFYYFDEPFFDFSMFPSITLSNISKKFITVALSGDGGDEIFGGYPRYGVAKKVELLKMIPLSIRRFIIKLIPSNLGLNDIKEGIKLSIFPNKDFYSEARSYIYKPKIYKEIMSKKLEYFLKKTKGNLTEAIIMMDLYFYTIPDNFLVKTDRASMSQSLEVRCPFLDYRFLNLSSKIPTNQKVSLFKTKILMRKMLKRYLPREIIKRKKQGFIPPILDWVNKGEDSVRTIKIAKKLNKDKIISKDWFNFFNKIFSKQDNVSQVYKFRLFLLSEWLNFWKIK